LRHMLAFKHAAHYAIANAPYELMMHRTAATAKCTAVGARLD